MAGRFDCRDFPPFLGEIANNQTAHRVHHLRGLAGAAASTAHDISAFYRGGY